MIRKTFFLSLLIVTGVLLFAQTSQVEARGCSRSSTRVQLNVGNAYSYNDAYVVRRYSAPVVVPTAVYVPQPCYNCTPVYAYPAPAYVEEVYVAPVRRPVGFGGLSFSWNFFN